MLLLAATSVAAQNPGFIFGTTALGEKLVRVGGGPVVESLSPQFYSANSVNNRHPQVGAVAPPAYIASSHAPLAVSPTLNKYLAQNSDGTYSFGHSGGPNARVEERDSSGVVRGAFNYVDAFGDVQSQQYIADANGFRTTGTDIPTPASAQTSVTFHSRRKRTAEASQGQEQGDMPAHVQRIIETYQNSPRYATVQQEQGNRRSDQPSRHVIWREPISLQMFHQLYQPHRFSQSGIFAEPKF